MTTQKAAHEVITMKDGINRQIDRALAYQAAKLVVTDEQRLEIFRLEMTLIEKLKHVYTLSKRVAKLSLPAGLMGRSE
jgi:phosphate:Na+ symporter